VSKILLSAYNIQKPLISYHSFNESKRCEEIINRLELGENIALISDAGTPLFQDPGFILIKECQNKNISYTTVPGASSILSALVLSGFELNQFQFLGFLPKKSGDAKDVLNNAIDYPGVSVFFESPRRTEDTLKLISELNPDCEIAIIREITKKFETVHKGSAFSLLEEFQKEPPRGEIVFVIKGCPKETTEDFTEFAMTLIQEGLSKKSAYKHASRFGYVDKDLIYKS
jgi:16S rRNA (cytidine1402-2'-O)-methyltransferase